MYTLRSDRILINISRNSATPAFVASKDGKTKEISRFKSQALEVLWGEACAWMLVKDIVAYQLFLFRNYVNLGYLSNMLNGMEYVYLHVP